MKLLHAVTTGLHSKNSDDEMLLEFDNAVINTLEQYNTWHQYQRLISWSKALSANTCLGLL